VGPRSPGGIAKPITSCDTTPSARDLLAEELTDPPTHSGTMIGAAIWAHIRPRAVLRLAVHEEALICDFCLASIAELGWVDMKGRRAAEMFKGLSPNFCFA